MEKKIMLGNFICDLRKRKNLTQSELGKLVGVSNKAVSKWENLEANPDISLIPKLAEILGVSADELLLSKENENKRDENSNYFLGVKGCSTKTNISYEFISERKTKKGTPYLHINLGCDEKGKLRKAKGIIAIGLIARGLVSFGIISLGLVSFGVIAMGLIGIGCLCLGALVAVGAISIGVGVSIGAVAIGTIAVGGIAIGILSVGGVSIGVWSHTGETGKAIGLFRFIHK